MNIGLFSPSQNPYSETFIQAHKHYLRMNVFYYYGNRGRVRLENQSLVSKIAHFKFRVLRNLQNKNYGFINDKSVIHSLKKNEIDVILIEYGTHAENLKDILAATEIPFVVHFHGYDASKYYLLKKTNHYAFTFNTAKKIIVVSNQMKNHFLSLGCAIEKLALNPCGPSSEFAKVTPAFNKEQFIAIGRFTEKKAPYYTILAFRKLLKKYPNAKLLMAGEGSLLETCKNLVRALELNDSIRFLGIISPERFRELLTESLAFVQHSIKTLDGDMEGTPVAILEASLSGIPVVSTRHAGIPDVIVENGTGLLSNEHDIQAMADNMIKILEDKNFAKELGSAGKKFIQENFSMKQHINRLQEVLNVTISS